MVELFEQDIKTLSRQSSKGLQLKWKNGDTWYKADNIGYEGFVEYLISHLLEYSTLSGNEYVLYDTTQIHYKRTEFLGCASRNFLPAGWQLITLERLFKNFFNVGLQASIWPIVGYEERIKFLVTQTERITGLTDFGTYMNKLLTIDALFLNEDRHSHNIAVLLDDLGVYHLCPIFDNGAALMADTKADYPINGDIYEMMPEVKARTFATGFDEQLDAVESVFGCHLTFHFTKQDIIDIVESEPFYSDEIKKRCCEIIFSRMAKYQYLFK